jgi:hypothetical protein
MKVSKYSEKELEKRIANVFKNSSEPAFWGCSNGTFLNSRQFAKLKDEDKKEYIEFKNPKFAAPSAEDVAKAKAELTEGEEPKTAKAEKPAKAAKAEKPKE